MKRLFFFAVFLAGLFAAAPSAQAQVYETTCPPGSTVNPGGSARDNSNQQLRQNYCTDANGNAILNFPVSAASGGTGWSKMGIVIPGGPTSATVVQEPTVFPVTVPGIVTTQPPGATVLGMFYTLGFGPVQMNYVESLDNGATWINSSISIAGHAHSGAAVIGGTVYVMAANAASGTDGIDLYTISGATVTLVKANIVTSGGGGWKGQSLANSGFWHDSDGNYYLLYEGQATGTGVWSIGLATCTAPSGSMTCTDFGSNPVLSNGSGSVSDPKSIRQLSPNSYITWVHSNGTASGVLPSDVYFATARSPHGPWTVSTNSVMYRTNQAEGVNSANGQLADPAVLTIGNECYMWDGAFPNGNTGINGGIELAIANQTCETLTAANQGVSAASFGLGLSSFGPPLRGSSTASITSGASSVSVGSVILTPGTWRLEAGVSFAPGGAGATANYTGVCITATITGCSISGVTFPEINAVTVFGSPTGVAIPTGFSWNGNTSAFTVTVFSNTTYYVGAFAGFSAGAMTATGEITAQRIY
jgi:hypothetical protein